MRQSSTPRTAGSSWGRPARPPSRGAAPRGGGAARRARAHRAQRGRGLTAAGRTRSPALRRRQKSPGGLSGLLALAGGFGRQTSGRRSKKGPAALALAAGAAGLAVAKRRRSNGAGDAPDRHLDVASEPREAPRTQEPPSPIDAGSEDVAQRGV